MSQAAAKKSPAPITVTPELAKEHGLTREEYDRMLGILGRPATITELGIFSAAWSEHCSYKSSRIHLAKLPTKGPCVIHGPGENAGVIDAGDNDAIVFKMESHNHPSFIEPYQGAATGVGGILRDVFTMGARPFANMNALRFGDPSHPKTRHLVAGVVAGIGGYGNCMGIPTVGGETNFHPAYNGNILVNAMSVGLADKNRIFLSAAAGVGNPVVYVGSKTGRDGIHGATMSSAEFDDKSEEKRPTVQVGDPFTEKLLLEACMELMQTDCIVAIQDMGAAGLTSSSVEMADKGGLGIHLDMEHVPQREANMTPYEMMLSESQERMLIILKPGSEAIAKAIFDKWDLDFAVIGRLTDTGRLVVAMNGETYADIPVSPLVDQAPKYDRPYVHTDMPAPLDTKLAAEKIDNPIAVLKTILAKPDLASKAWIWQQYDSLIGGNSVLQPGGGDAALCRLPNSNKGIAITTDVTPRYCKAHPKTGGMQAVAKSWRNITATGATPLAVTDNLNFGNPEKPEIMGQFVGCIEGMAEACRALDYPVVSGNVSLYNETNGQAILPTPAIGGVGVIADVAKAVGQGVRKTGLSIILIGDGVGHLGQSLYLRDILGREEGPPPAVDLTTERRNGDFVRGHILAGTVSACHDLSDGGLGVAVAEMVLSGSVGIDITLSASDMTAGLLFGEDQARYIVATDQADAILADAQRKNVPAQIIGRTIDDGLIFGAGNTISSKELRKIHEEWLPSYMAGTA